MYGGGQAHARADQITDELQLLRRRIDTWLGTRDDQSDPLGRPGFQPHLKLVAPPGRHRKLEADDEPGLLDYLFET